MLRHTAPPYTRLPIPSPPTRPPAHTHAPSAPRVQAPPPLRRVQAPPQAPDAVETANLEAETNALWAELQRALATKRELQRKLASAENVAKLWASHRESVQQLAAAHSASGLGHTLDSAQQLNGTLQQGWQILRTAEAVGDVETACSGLAPTGPRGLHQRFSKRRTEINTVSVPDLSLLSSLLCAS